MSASQGAGAVSRRAVVGAGLLAPLAAAPLNYAVAATDDRRSAARERWRDERFGMFITSGPSTLIGRGDWSMGLEDIPRDEYARIAARYNPAPGASREWARLARKAGMRYAVFVAKFHDGYCLWDTKTTDYNSVRQGCGRDLTREYVDAMRAEGISVGIYFSLLDWYHPDGMRSQTDPAARARFVAFVHAQLRELMANYGKIDILWYDVAVPLDATGWRSDEMNAMVRQLQPEIVINNRNWAEGDFTTSEQEVNPSERDWEACMTINESWFYTRGDELWKSPSQILRHLNRAAQYGGNYLLNIGPRPDGSVPQPSVAVLEAVGRWTATHGEALYGTRASSVKYSRTAGFTRRGDTLYTHVHFWPGAELPIGGITTPPTAAWFVHNKQPVSFRHSGTRLVFDHLPEESPQPLTPVIAARFDRFPVQDCLAGRTAERLHELYRETGIQY